MLGGPLDSDIAASCKLAPVRELLPIGRFGKQAQLTPRQLRYYHALGLLVPAAVDPGSGYRYYAEAQLANR